MTNAETKNLTVRLNYQNQEIDIVKILEEYLLHLIERELKISC